MKRKLGYRLGEVSDATGLGLRTVQRKVANGEIVAHRCGKVVLVYEEDLRAFLDSLPTVRPAA
ncbi:helix-turn-helix domain-containing protein [Mycobacterium avium]|uniref:helix-turn-helix domain-containing protein n=1 Tax=Mycobacterium avium TaxID=1764 RepID=UPI0007A0C26D|nr:helix-turn-helix domain-containing protein [Mycobacterium avium]